MSNDIITLNINWSNPINAFDNYSKFKAGLNFLEFARSSFRELFTDQLHPDEAQYLDEKFKDFNLECKGIFSQAKPELEFVSDIDTSRDVVLPTNIEEEII